MNVLGISAYYHDAAACLLRDGRIVAAAAEERFTRSKHDRRLPKRAIDFCLEEAGLTIMDLDAVGYYEDPRKKLARQLWSGRLTGQDPLLPEREIRELVGYEGEIFTFDHHASHAASAFWFSGFERAAILTIDGVGEWTTTGYGLGEGARIERFEEVSFPDSLGLLYSAITSYLGFEVNEGEYKVMGLAPYGTPRYIDRLAELVVREPGAGYTLRPEYFDYVRGGRMYSDALADLLGVPARSPGAELTGEHGDLAASLQHLLEEILLDKVRYLHDRVGGDALCMAGGVALNCVANGRILREGPFRRLFVQPAAGDDGACLGAAALAHARRTGERIPREPLEHMFFGPRYGSDDILELLAAIGVSAHDYRGRGEALADDVADRIARGQVIGWFQGKMEFGPRALGARSILADPRDPGMRDRLNRLVKMREAFRPFAPSVLAERAAEVLELDHPSPFMLETCRVKDAARFPAVAHVDGSARPQTVDGRVAPRFAALLEAFLRKTGCPMVLNTSFNMRGEPIVCTPRDAVRTLLAAEMDALVIEDFIVERSDVPDGLLETIERWSPPDPQTPTSLVYAFL